jgi:hypothetical protein
MASASCAAIFAALKKDAAKAAPAKKCTRADPTSGDGLIFLTTSQRSLGDICSIPPDRLAVAFPNIDSINDLLGPAKEAKEAFMIRNETNPITGWVTTVHSRACCEMLQCLSMIFLLIMGAQRYQ